MRHILSPLLILISLGVAAQQSTFHAGILPEIAISYSLNEKLKHTTKIESQHETYFDKWEYSYSQTDFQSFLDYRFNPFWKGALGYQFRLVEKGNNAHRTIQQIAAVQKYSGFRLGHRFRIDQTFYQSGAAVKYRIRYRLSTEIPLEGESLDPGEYFIILSDEALYSRQDGKNDFENRLAIALGYFVGSKNKLEAGLDYRLEKLLDRKISHNLWLKLGWFYTL
ncbi:MAG: DUF2490 domain-containing protein [Bacteroidetes bacterium]|jgi:hypothetical protein|nr:DUF2490 domain-containing protein [Bacteroidota bacterium]